ncbi:alpha/beta fold hydrolase [Sphingomonas glaciei]|uniref:Alpha/beta fold hydrolase n=1 Tax=Sphingomonas glaciei TaxID=2938948 RepID=A0ABY5MSX2_9SPHN|nr:alpha/beta fold hydrolase [Sphingomonas glaciei]UUR07034.1 alpha/beta fold hydrolase [Sphingomonas glaciei]
MQHIETSWGRVGCSTRGSGGVPLLFLHGVGSDRSAWDRQLDPFGEERLAIAIDMPGYGHSDAGHREFEGRQDFAASALAVLDALGQEQAHVCGLSLGGVIALAMAGQAPDRLASLVLADSFAGHPEGPAILGRSLAGAEQLGMARLADSRADALLAQPPDPAVRREVVDTMSRIDPAAYARAAEAVWLADQRGEAAGVSCPTLILYGSEDRITPPALSEELKSLIPHAGLIEITGAGHLPNLEQPAIFNRVLAGFLADAER